MKCTADIVSGGMVYTKFPNNLELWTYVLKRPHTA
jgi:hypothetical protein